MSTAQQGFPPADILQSTDVKIESVPLLANTETPYVLQNGINQLIIKSRSVNSIKYSFVSGDILLGDYWTIPRGCTENITSLDFTGKIIYIEAEIACTVEIMQLYT